MQTLISHIRGRKAAIIQVRSSSGMPLLDCDTEICLFSSDRIEKPLHYKQVITYLQSLKIKEWI